VVRLGYRLYSRHDKTFVSGTIQNKHTARNRADKLDDKYGGYDTAIVEVSQDGNMIQRPQQDKTSQQLIRW
jgi:hypothetical protein